MKPIATLRWTGGIDGSLWLIDQTLLPVDLTEIECHSVEMVWEAIKVLRVRGAPAIGVAAAYGVCIGLQTVAAGDEAPPGPALSGRFGEAPWPIAGVLTSLRERPPRSLRSGAVFSHASYLSVRPSFLTIAIASCTTATRTIELFTC